MREERGAGGAACGRSGVREERGASALPEGGCRPCPARGALPPAPPSRARVPHHVSLSPVRGCERVFHDQCDGLTETYRLDPVPRAS